MSSPNRCGISFSSFSSFLDSSTACLGNIYDGASRAVEDTAGDAFESADAFNFASANFSLDRGVGGFLNDYSMVRRFQEMEDALMPMARGLSARPTELRAAGIGPLMCLESGTRMCLPAETELTCSLVSSPECESSAEPPLLIREDLLELIEEMPEAERGIALAALRDELRGRECEGLERPQLLIREDVLERLMERRSERR